MSGKRDAAHTLAPELLERDAQDVVMVELARPQDQPSLYLTAIFDTMLKTCFLDSVSKTLGLIARFINEPQPPAFCVPWRAARMQEDQLMPLLHISMRIGKPDAYRQAILDGLYRAMREALNVPEDDQFMTISELAPANFRCGNAYGVARSDDAVLIQITVFAFAHRRAEEGAVSPDHGPARREPGIRPEDVFVNVLDAPKENWSVGHGIAQFA